ncbi:MAG: SPOR domain-containing protein [Chitinophagaceae bacterium]|nr:SPOR domain-containing protein [Chitinophagaceae bacterium]
MKGIQFILLLVLFGVSTQAARAQEDGMEPDSNQFENNVTIFKDTRLDILDKRPALMAKAEEEEKKDKEIPLYKPIVSSDGKKKVTGSIYTAKGFRIIIYNGPDRNQALLAKNMFSRAFPSVASYLSYNVPSYKIKVGNFEDRKEASAFLRKVNKAFPAAFIVPDVVTIKNINVIK